MEEGSGFVSDAGKFGNRLDDAGFIVGQHDADEAGVGPEGCTKARGGYKTFGIARQKGDLDPAFGECLGGVEDGVMLDLRGDEMLAGLERAEQGKIVRLGTAGGENDFRCAAAKKRGDLLAGSVDSRAGKLAGLMDAGWIGEVFGVEGAHGVEDRGKKRGRGVRVHVNALHS